MLLRRFVINAEFSGIILHQSDDKSSCFGRNMLIALAFFLKNEAKIFFRKHYTGCAIRKSVQRSKSSDILPVIISVLKVRQATRCVRQWNKELVSVGQVMHEK